MSFVITNSTNQVYRIEVSSPLKHFLFCRVIHVNLRTFEDLQGDCSVAIVCQERTTTRFAYVLHHTADTHRTVQLLFQIDHQLGVFEVFHFGILAEKLFLQELKNFHNLLMRIFSTIKQLKILESFFLQSYQYTGNQFLISHCVSFQFIGHYIVDILDKDNIGVKVIEVLD